MSGGRKRKLRGGNHLVPADPNQRLVSQAPIQQSQSRGQHQQTASLVVQQSKYHQGPLPSPETLRGFGEVIPGLDEKIVRWVEEETAHRRGMETREMSLYERAVRWDGWLQIAGMVLHFLLLAALFALAWLALTKGHPGAAVAAILTALGTAIGTFRRGAKAAKQ